MVPLPYPPASASYPELHTRSPSRYETSLRDAPAATSSQSYPDNYNVSFADTFISGGLVDNVNVSAPVAMETTPQFGFPQQSPLGASGPAVVPTVVRKKPSGFFALLDKFVISGIEFDFSELVSSVVGCDNKSSDQLSTMWSGILTGSKLDRNYQTILLIIEKVFTRFLDETIKRLRDELKAHQLAVFLRQVWTAILPVSSESVERWIIDYHSVNADSFYKDVGLDEWDAEDEAKEKQLDELDQELEELQAEIDVWERIQRNYPSNSDEKALRFVESKLLFAQRLNLLASVSAEATTAFLDGGFLEKPTIPLWEHPERRKKLKIRDIMNSAVVTELGSESYYTNGEDEAMGIPASGFCFEPGVVADSRWDSWAFPGWTVEQQAQPPHHHRLSLDALSAFN